MKSAHQQCFPCTVASALPQQRPSPPYLPLTSCCKNTETATLTTFRINTCKSVSKQRTLTAIRINTYKKEGEGGIPFAIRHLSSIQLPASIPTPLRLCFHLRALGACPSGRRGLYGKFFFFVGTHARIE